MISVMIDGRSFFDLLLKTLERIYENLSKDNNETRG